MRLWSSVSSHELDAVADVEVVARRQQERVRARHDVSGWTSPPRDGVFSPGRGPPESGRSDSGADPVSSALQVRDQLAAAVPRSTCP